LGECVGLVGSEETWGSEIFVLKRVLTQKTVLLVLESEEVSALSLVAEIVCVLSCSKVWLNVFLSV
jgi:hypothetical protein